MVQILKPRFRHWQTLIKIWLYTILSSKNYETFNSKISKMSIFTLFISQSYWFFIKKNSRDLVSVSLNTCLTSYLSVWVKKILISTSTISIQNLKPNISQIQIAKTSNSQFKSNLFTDSNRDSIIAQSQYCSFKLIYCIVSLKVFLHRVPAEISNHKLFFLR